MTKRKGSSTVALAMIVKDEEAVLARCLDSVEGVVDEIVIVDTGSTDRTKEVAASYASHVPGVGGSPGLKVLDFTWRDDFSAARNFALDNCSADWILHLDADEELASGKKELLPLLGDKRRWAYYVNIVVAPDIAAAAGGAETFLAVRLFRRRPDIRYRYPIHEQIRVDEADRAVVSPVKIVHFGPSLRPGPSKKGERNIPILLRAIEADPADPFLLAMLGNEYFQGGRWEEAAGWYSRALELEERAVWTIPAARNLAWCLFKLGRRQESLGLLRDLQTDYPDFTDLFFLEGSIALAGGELERAAMLYVQCLRMGEPAPYYNPWGGTGGRLAKSRLEEITALMKTRGSAKPQ